MLLGRNGRKVGAFPAPAAREQIDSTLHMTEQLIICLFLENWPPTSTFVPLPAVHRGTSQMRSRGESLGTAQSVLKRAMSKKESVGESYRGFMSEVKEELEVQSMGSLVYMTQHLEDI